MTGRFGPGGKGRDVLVEEEIGAGPTVGVTLRRRAGYACARSIRLGEQGTTLVGATRQYRGELRRHLAELRMTQAALRTGLAAVRRMPSALSEGAEGTGASEPPHPSGESGRFRRRRSLQEAAELFYRTRAPRLVEEVLDQCRGWAGPMARGVARNSAAESDDLGQVALLAVMRALERYKPEVGPFEPFARVTVAGEVRHYLRATEWALRVPRRLQEGYREVAKARDEAAGDSLSEQQLGQITGLGPEDVRAVSGLRRRAQSLQSMQAAVGDRCLSSTDTDLESVPEVADLDMALDGLGEDARRLIDLYYFQDLSQRDVAQLLGTNQVRVSRLLNQTILGLRRELTV